MNKFFDYITSPAFYLSIICIAITFAILTFIKRYLIKKVAYTNKSETHKNTLKGVVFNILQYIVLLVCIFLVLKNHGVDVGTLFTGLGIVATIIGLALQDMIKDIIMGINIYNNNFYKVGDVVTYDGKPCEVKYFNARVTKLKSLLDGSTFTLNNSTISAIQKLKDSSFKGLMFDFDADKAKIDKAYNDMVPRINDLYGASNAVYYGITEINESGVKYGIGYTCPPKLSVDVGCKVFEIIYDELKKNGISPSFSDEVKIKEMLDNADLFKAQAKEHVLTSEAKKKVNRKKTTK